MRTKSVSNIRPLTRRGSDTVVGWIFRLTLEDGDQSIFDDILYEVPPADHRPLGTWSQRGLIALLNAISQLQPEPHGHPAVAKLHERLDARMAVEERRGFDLRDLEP